MRTTLCCLLTIQWVFCLQSSILAQSDPMAAATVLSPTNNTNYLVFGAPGTADVYPSSYHSMSFNGNPSTQYPTSFDAKNYVETTVVNQATSSGTATTNSHGDWATAFSISGNYVTLFHGIYHAKASTYLVVSYDVAAGPNYAVPTTFYVTVF